MTINKQYLIIMTRLPEPGRTKTRLEPTLGPDGAANLHDIMTQRLLALARHLGGEAALEVHHSGGDSGQMAAWLGGDLNYVTQCGKDLGQRMANAFEHAFTQGARRVVLIGCDCPGVDEDLLRRAFTALDGHDLVLGPAQDGGYYLIGLKIPAPELFNGPDWGTDQVFGRTIAIADGLGLSTAHVDRLADIDRPEDLAIWEDRLRQDAERVSVVIPALNEAANIAKTVQSAIDEAFEVIVADGGSSDQTAAVARAAGAVVINTPKGRARQMNAGARWARGGALLFLHADTLLQPGWATEVRRILADRCNSAGAFTFRLDDDGTWLRITEWGVARRCKYGRMPYGDQGLFARTADFRRIGGYPDQPIMEDWELVRAMQKRGRIDISPLAAITSARRWQSGGGIRVWLMNQVVVAAYHLGVDRARLRNWYDKITK